MPESPKQPPLDNLGGVMFWTATRFSQLVEKKALETEETLLTSILLVCDDHGLDPDSLVSEDGKTSLISGPLKEKLLAEAQRLHLLKDRKIRRPTLPME